MGKFSRLAAATALTVSLAALSAGPAAGAATAATPSAGGATVLTIATIGSVDSLNPFLAQRLLPTALHRYMYDFLTNYDSADDHVIPALAESWTTSADKLTWTFQIRSGMTWSDGQPVTASDVAWTYNLIMTNEAAATANGNFVANFKSVTAPDPHTLVIVLTKPQATMLALDIPIVPEHVWKDHVADISTFNNDASFPIVGDGPFIMTGYKKSQFIELTANKHYWRGAPKFDKVVYKYYKDLDAEAEALKKGEVDFVSGLTPAQFDALSGVPGIARNKAQGKGFYALAINPGATTTSGAHFGDGNPALRNTQVRTAIMYAIDSKTLVTKTLGGYGEQGEGYLPPLFAANHWKPDPGQAHAFDPGKANQLLDAAGYKRGAGGNRTTPDGKPFTLRLLGETQRASDTQNAAYIKEWLAAVGIPVNTTIIDQGTMSDQEVAGNYDLAFDGWSTNPDPDYVLALQTCADRPSKAGASFPGDNFVCDPAYDDLYAQQIAEYDPAKRSALIKQAQQVLYADSYINVLYYANTLEAYRSDRIASMDKQPRPNGAYATQDGYWAWWSAVPVAKSASGGSSKSGLVAAIVAAAVVVVIVVVVVLVVRRRRATVEERE
jgi:peptide/nickel transport system substrate-binding protein